LVAEGFGAPVALLVAAGIALGAMAPFALLAPETKPRARLALAR
jgi:hypothetical protein